MLLPIHGWRTMPCHAMWLKDLVSLHTEDVMGYAAWPRSTEPSLRHAEVILGGHEHTGQRVSRCLRDTEAEALSIPCHTV